ncbi:transposase [Leptolyngbya sp. FACHB-261]|nr:transposase [Leptolyngbya sp. FACHB-261]
MKALTGLSPTEFQHLLPSFEDCLQTANPSLHRQRQRAPGAGRKHTLAEASGKLFFSLFYLKCYPTFDLASFFFGVNHSQCHRWLHQLLPILEQALGRELVLPKRNISSVEEFVQLFPEVKDVLVDGTERPIQRPKNQDRQKANYSGKKKRHTKKNLVVSDGQKVLMLSATEAGKRHDYQMFK